MRSRSYRPTATHGIAQLRLWRRSAAKRFAGQRLTLRTGPVIANRVKYEPRLHIVLVQPEIPHNTGSVGRTCVAIGAKLWLVRPLGFRVDDYYLRRAGLDYWEHLEWEVVDDWQQLAERLPTDRAWLFSKTAERTYTTALFALGDVLVFGNESQGLPPTLLSAGGPRLLRIPVRPQVRSLNLSNAVAVVVYEALRQWSAAE